MKGIDKEHWEFIHRSFKADKWEAEVKKFIIELPNDSISIHQQQHGELKKLSQELRVLGFYVKYKYGPNPSVEFSLNREQISIDGTVTKDGSGLESVQIATAYFGFKEVSERKEEANCSGHYTRCEWVSDRYELLSKRILDRVKKKVAKDYRDIDTLLLGVDSFFANKTSDKEYRSYREPLETELTILLAKTEFQQIAIVDVDWVGPGGLWVICR